MCLNIKVIFHRKINIYDRYPKSPLFPSRKCQHRYAIQYSNVPKQDVKKSSSLTKHRKYSISLHPLNTFHQGIAYPRNYGGGSRNPLYVPNLVPMVQQMWQPLTILPVRRSDHPLDCACSQSSLDSLRTYCNRPATVIFVQHEIKECIHVTTSDLRDLLSYSKPIADETITLYLELLTTQYDIAFLATNTIPKLQTEGWSAVKRSFASYRNRSRTNSRPFMTRESAIIIPCYVDNCHWVTVVRREVGNQVIFLFADDLNNNRTEQTLKTLLSQHTSSTFYPSSSKWIACRNYTYSPHSNECGPRSLVAATILALHPNPSNYILLPCMHDNLAQISRTWVAMSLLTNNINHAAVTSLLKTRPRRFPQVTRVTSNPAHLIQWQTSIPTRPTSTSIGSNTPIRKSATVTKDNNQDPTAHSERGPTTNFASLLYKDQPPILRRTIKTSTKPARRKVQRLPGQLLLSHYFPSKVTVAKLQTTLPVKETKVSEQTSNIKHKKTPTPSGKPTRQLQASNPPARILPLQRTMFDFQYFKPQASVSQSDPDIWGHTPESIDTASTFRLVFQNPNGIRPSVTEPDFMFSLHLCHEIGAGAICLAETNLNWHHTQHHAALRRCLLKNWPASKYQVSVPDEVFLSNYQPGGTSTLIVDRWTSRVISSGMDPYGLGRWSYVILRGKHEINICIITAYRVCNDRHTGPKTAYQQQKRQLSAMFRQHGKIVVPDPNRQFIIDLQCWISELQKERTQIILGLDNNDELNPANSQVIQTHYNPSLPLLNTLHNGTLDTLIRSTGLVDVLSHHHPSEKYPATYNRGKKRIDIILVSASLLPAVHRSGILPYHSLFQGDHRPCYIDIDVNLAFDGKVPSICPPCQRTLQLKDPRIVQNYITTLSLQFNMHKVLPKLQELNSIQPDEWSFQHSTMYERLDRLISETMLYAENRAAKRYTNTFDWSPTLVQSVYAERFWKLALRQSHGRVLSPSLLQRTKEYAGIGADLSRLTLPDIVQCLASARQSRKELQQQHQQLRKNYLEKLAEALVLKRAPYLDSDPKYEDRLTSRTVKEVKRLLRLEQKRRYYKMIGSQLSDHNENTGGLTRIDVPAHDKNIPLTSLPDPKTWQGPWRSVTDPTEIAQYVSIMNARQYNQAQNTPFGSGYLADQIGLNIDKPAAEQILNGTFLPDPSINLFPETIKVIEYLKRPSPYCHPFPTTITSNEFQATYKRVKERTSSSISGRHVGHYKAAAQDDFLSNIHSVMMSLPYKIGFSPNRWQRIVDVMLEKEPGNPKLHRLRIIALIENDFNQSQRILIARRLTHTLEDHKLVPDMQYGSRPGKLCITPALNKQLSFDIIRQTKYTAAIIENDAVGCYDRLMNPLLLLAMRRLGVTDTMAASLSNTWMLTNHAIKTQYGISDITYASTPDTPLFGPSQGSTTGPTFWQLSYVLLTACALEASGHCSEENRDACPVPGLSFQSVDSGISIDHNGESFVDDSNLGNISSLPNEPHQVSQVDQVLHSKSALQNLQLVAQRWERSLFTVGGAINFQKSFWFIFHWKWKEGVARLIPPPEDLKLHLTEGYRLESPIIVPQKSVHDTYRTLGVHISPSGDTSTAAQVLLEKAKDYQVKIALSSLPREAALLSYNVYLLPKLGYPLPAMSLSEEACYNIQSPTLLAVLPKLHLNRNIARSIVFGPTRYGGLSIRTLYSIQCIGQLTLFVGHSNAVDKTAKLLGISLSYLQLVVGVCSSVLTLHYHSYSTWIDSYWLTSFWRFLCKSQITLELSNQWIPSLARIGDMALMEHFVKAGYPAAQLTQLNRCRLYLQVITLADIVSADGSLILPEAFIGVPLSDRKSDLKWPNQQRPPSKDWAVWSSALKCLQPRNKLLRPLGTWLISNPHQNWIWYMDPVLPKLYKKTLSDQWQRFEDQVVLRRPTRSVRPIVFDVSAGITVPQAPRTICPATVETNRYTNLTTAIRGPPFVTTSSHQPSPDTSFHMAVRQPFYLSILGTQLWRPDQAEQLVACLTSDGLSAVSRTLYHTEYLINSWSLFTSTGSKHSWASARGISRDVSSPKRLELEGLVAAIFVVASLCQEFNVRGGSFTLYCLTKTVTQQLRTIKYTSVSKALLDHYDLLAEFKHQLELLEKRCKVTISYLDFSHKSDTSPQFRAVDQLAVLLDEQENLLSLPLPPSDYIRPPACAATLFYDRRPLVAKIHQTIRRQLYSRALRSTICKQESWTEAQFQTVDWPALEVAFTRVWSCKRISYSKLTNKLLNTNAQNKKFYGKPSFCPCCLHSEETIMHVFTCPECTVTTFRDQQQEVLWANLRLIDTPSSLLTAIQQGIKSQEVLPSVQSKDHPPLVLEAYSHQETLGWEAFLRGRISSKWQLAYATDQFTPAQSLKWAGQLIGYLLHYSQQLWNFRCGVVHGATIEESRQKHRSSLISLVQTAFEEFTLDPFHIPSNWRRLFQRPLPALLLSDSDTLSCWLRSYSEAVQQQDLIEASAKRSQRNLFRNFREKSAVHRSSNVYCEDEDLESSIDDDDSILDYIPFDPGPVQ